MAESIYDETNEDCVIVIGLMDKDAASVTKWVNCADLPVIEHLVHELSEIRTQHNLESMSSNASMADVSGSDNHTTSGGQPTSRKAEMATQTILTRKEIDQMQVDSRVMREQFQQLKANVDMIIKKDGIKKQ